MMQKAMRVLSPNKCREPTFKRIVYEWTEILFKPITIMKVKILNRIFRLHEIEE